MSHTLIESVDTVIVDLPTIRPHKLAMHTMQQQTLVIIRVRCSDGIEGIGESTTIGGLAYGNESPESIKTNIDSHLGPLLVGQDAANINAAMLRLGKVAKGNTFAKSGLESALLDAQGKRLGLPVSELLGGRVRDSLEVAWTLASGDTARDIAEAEQMLDIRRHRLFKLKIGANEVSADLKHVIAIKKALGERASVRVDVNQYWDESQAIRAIEGPLYVAGAPIVEGEARMDDGSEDGVATVMFLQGKVTGPDGKPLAGATVDLWHANTQGNYSYFDKSQSEYNLRRRIVTDAEGRYRARSIVPSGYGCSPDGPTQEVLDLLGRHGQRPAHIHFFISAPGHRHLTTQINLAGDKYLWDDFAYATRDGLIGDIHFNDDPEAAHARGVEGRFAEVVFDFQLQHAPAPEAEQRSQRPRALQEA
ncbi:dioxygenase family protein [Stutzerimonas nitrititolerans]|nr:enolase C-terminal domain-like protein [Stutzerimonas nitrititolerans]